MVKAAGKGPESNTLFSRMAGVRKRLWDTIERMRPLSLAAASGASHSSGDLAIGFSSGTCLPPRRKATARGAWAAGGEQTETASIPGSSASAGASASIRRASPYLSLGFTAAPGWGLANAAIRRRPGKAKYPSL
jgi:hypothetical protein